MLQQQVRLRGLKTYVQIIHGQPDSEWPLHITEKQESLLSRGSLNVASATLKGPPMAIWDDA